MKRILLPLLLALALPALPAAAEPAGLRALFERAWERSSSGRAAEARRDEGIAGRAAADSLLAGSPSVAIAERNDRQNRNRGQRERELELALPLRLPGEREARRLLAEGDVEEIDAALAAARLALAGELRLAVWALAAASEEARIAEQRQVLAQRLEADVARREAAGELARTDLLLARQEALAARADAAAAATRRLAAGERLRVLSGGDVLPGNVEETLAASSAESHPRLRLAAAAAARARAALDLARESRRDGPELSLGVQESRDDFSSPLHNSLRIGIRIPFATEARNAPRVAATNTALVQAETERRRIEAEVAAEERQTEAELAAAALSAALAVERAAAAGERARLLARAFELGELPLPEMLRAQSAALEARLESARSQAAHGLAKARRNQARGVLP
jgi:cobalt-zinc-cadmium efflux system outer membrane protein